MHTQYASLRQQLPALTIAAVSGGNLTGSGTVELTYQGRNRAGWNLPRALASVSYTAGQRIAITIPSTARATGEDIHEWVISIAVTPATPNSIRQAAIVAGYDADQTTPRALPATIYLSEDEHLVVGAGQQVATLAALPIGDELINGMVREVANIGDSTGRILEYREESTTTPNSNTVFPAATGRWHAISGFSTYITDTLAAGGCDRALSALDPAKVIQPPPYPVDGSTGTFVRYWFFGSRAAGGPATAQGTRVGLRVFDGGLDRSASFDGLLQYIFQGYVDPADGTRDTSGMTTEAQQTYSYGKAGAHLLEKDLPAGEAAEIAVAPRFTLAEQPSLTQGAVLSVGLRAYTQAGSLNPLPGFFGNAIAPEGDRLRVVPDGSGVKVLGGSAAVGTLAFPLIGEQLVVGLAEDTAGQYVHINGNGIAYVDDGDPGQQEAIRAKVSTESGRSAAGVASSYVAVGAGDTLTVTVTHGRSVRANYPEPSGATSVIAGNSDGTFNPPQMAVYLERQSDGELWEFLFTVTDTATQDVTIENLVDADAMPASIPTAPAANFSLFGPGAASFTSPAGSSDFTAGNYRVSFAYVYDGAQVTAIQHEAESPAGDWLREFDATLAEFAAAAGAGGTQTLYRLSSVVTAPPGDAEVVLDNDALSDVTELFISTTAQNGVDASSFLEQLQPGAKVLIANRFDNSGHAFYDVDFVSEETGYYAIAVTSASTGGTLSADVAVGFVFAGTPGATGPAGPQGDPGADGADGIDGVDGADGVSGFGLRFTFSTSTSSGPSSGQLRFNNATYSSVTSIFASETDRNSASISALLAAIADGSPLLVLDDNDSSAFAYFTLIGQTDNGSDRTLSVTHVASGLGTFSGDVSLTFAARGATGAAGSTGSVSAATALELDEQGSAPSGTTNKIKVANVNNVLQWVDESGTVYTVPTSKTGVVREIWVGAGAMTPRTTNGAAAATVESATNDIAYDVFDFDQTTSEGACFQISFPRAWNSGTVKAKFYWTAATGSGTVTWSLRGGSLADDDAIDTAYGTAQAVTDTLIATGDLHVSAATAALTIAGSPAVDDWCYFEVSRDVADTLSADARLMGIKLQYTESTTEPSAW